jgi:hypothetical protein
VGDFVGEAQVEALLLDLRDLLDEDGIDKRLEMVGPRRIEARARARSAPCRCPLGPRVRRFVQRRGAERMKRLASGWDSTLFALDQALGEAQTDIERLRASERHLGAPAGPVTPG